MFFFNIVFFKNFKSMFFVKNKKLIVLFVNILN